MKGAWEIKKLGEVANYFIGLTYSPKDVSDKGVIVLRSSNIQNGKIDFSDIVRVNRYIKEGLKVKNGDILMCSRNGSKSLVGKTATIFEIEEDMTFGTFMTIIRSSYNSYLSWFFLSDEFRKQINGGENPIINQITKYMLDDVEVPIPPLDEQKRIVEILDETFTAIDKAKANLKRNLHNATELFQNAMQVVFANKGADWEEKKLGEVCGFEKVQNKRNDLPYVGLEHIESNTGRFLGSKKPFSVKSSTFTFSKGHVLYGRLRPYLNKVLLPDFDGHCSTEIFPIKVQKNLDKTFLFYWLTLPETVKKIDATWTGARMPRANMNAVLEFEFFLPSYHEQRTIANKLDKLSSETKKLEVLYQQKLKNLEELKKSILQKAFAGELTVNAIKQTVPVPAKVINISATDLQASIIAFALQKHQGKKTAATFGNVKAEKITNTAQYFLEIELERQPYKDAAGPNDFKRLKFVQSRAAKAGIFSVSERAGGYSYHLSRQADAWIQKAKEALGEKWNALEELIDLFVKMDTEQAEVVATVYAAWNNLLLDNKTITDEAIVYEAREAWHPAKMQIDREKFFKSIDWLRRNNKVPKGTGKKVMDKNQK